LSHLLVDTKIYNKAKKAFYDAKQRCTNTKHLRYADWGGRGITFDFVSFSQFIDDVGYPQEGQSLDRKDNNKSYCVGNIQWASRSTQQLNKRPSKRNKLGVVGVREVSVPGLVTKTYQAYMFVNGKFNQLYTGPSFEDACLARKSFNETKTPK